MFCKTKTKPKVSEKKGATGQSFIRKEITCYRIGTLVGIFFHIWQVSQKLISVETLIRHVVGKMFPKE